MAKVVSKDFTEAKKLPPVGFNLMITRSRDCYWSATELNSYVLVRGSLNSDFSCTTLPFGLICFHLKSIKHEYIISQVSLIT